MKLIPLVSRSWQGHGVVGAVGAKDWAGGFLDLKADLKSSTFVGNEPLTVESRAGYLGKYFFFFFCRVLSGLGNQRITHIDFQNHNESYEATV